MFKTTFMPSALAAGLAIDPVAERTCATWTAGDFGRIASGFAPGAADFIGRLKLTSGSRLLDVACGTGNLAFPAARAGAIVTGIDIAPNLIAQAIVRAKADGVLARFEVGNAEELPYGDASFDVTVSMFGVMFAGRPASAAGELLRVTRRGGRIAMANWTSNGFAGQMLRLVARHAPPPAGASVLAWGDEDVARDRLAGASRVDCVRRRIVLRYPCSPAETMQLFLRFYGPMVCACAALDALGRVRLQRDLTALWTEHNRGGNNLTYVESEYLEVRAIR